MRLRPQFKETSLHATDHFEDWTFAVNAFMGTGGFHCLKWERMGGIRRRRPKRPNNREVRGEFGGWIRDSLITFNADPRTRSIEKLWRSLAGFALRLRRGAGKCNLVLTQKDVHKALLQFHRQRQ